MQNREEALNAVLDGMSYLIRNHATCAASEQYNPSKSPDSSDDYIRERKQWVTQLRMMREKFEDLVTGLL